MALVRVGHLKTLRYNISLLRSYAHLLNDRFKGDTAYRLYPFASLLLLLNLDPVGYMSYQRMNYSDKNIQAETASVCHYNKPYYRNNIELTLPGLGTW